MGKSLIIQAKEFILKNTKKNNFIFTSDEIKLSLKNFLIQNGYLYSPIKNIFILKKREENIYEKILKNKFKILEKLTYKNKEIISGEFLINYYLGDYKKAKIFRIITKSKNFESILGDENTKKISDEKIKIIFKPSNVARISRKIKINNSNLIIETKLSFIVNNYYLFKDNLLFQKIILDCDFDIFEIENLIKKGFKFAAISKLAIFYKNNNQEYKYEIIKQASKNNGKKLDRRGVKIKKKKQVKKIKKEINLDDLF